MATRFVWPVSECPQESRAVKAPGHYPGNCCDSRTAHGLFSSWLDVLVHSEKVCRIAFLLDLHQPIVRRTIGELALKSQSDQADKFDSAAGLAAKLKAAAAFVGDHLADARENFVEKLSGKIGRRCCFGAA